MADTTETSPLATSAARGASVVETARPPASRPAQQPTSGTPAASEADCEKADGTVQAFDRIDRLYVRNPQRGEWSLHPVAALVLPDGWEDERIPVRSRVFPSDHAAVVVDFEWRRAPAAEEGDPSAIVEGGATSGS